MKKIEESSRVRDADKRRIYGKNAQLSATQKKLQKTIVDLSPIRTLGQETRCNPILVVPERIIKSGAHSVSKHRKKLYVLPLHCIGSTSTISRFCKRFRDGQYSLVSFLFAVLLLTVPVVPRHW